MTRPLRFDPAAARELVEAASFYDAENPGLGGAFLDAVERAPGQIRDFPESSPIASPPLRAKVVAAFPFSVVYWVADEAIVVLAVARQRRRKRLCGQSATAPCSRSRQPSGTRCSASAPTIGSSG